MRVAHETADPVRIGPLGLADLLVPALGGLRLGGGHTDPEEFDEAVDQRLAGGYGGARSPEGGEEMTRADGGAPSLSAEDEPADHGPAES